MILFLSIMQSFPISIHFHGFTSQVTNVIVSVCKMSPGGDGVSIAVLSHCVIP